MDDIILAVANAIPKFNADLLRGFTTKQINSAPEFIDTTFKEAVKLNNGAIDYIGYNILKPEDRVRFELGAKKQQKRQKIQIATSEMQLVEFRFVHEGRHVDPPVYLYTPYMHKDMLVVRDKLYGVHRGISEQVFSRLYDKGVDGIMVRPIRTPIPFNRKISFRLVSSASNEVIQTEFVITTKLHSKKHGRRKCDTTNILYLICKFGFYNVVTKLGVAIEDIGFVEYPVVGDPDYEYFLAKAPSKMNNLHMRVRRDVLQNPVHRKLIANILYTLHYFDIQTAEDLTEASGSIWRVMLGRILYPDTTFMKARSDADTHIASVDSVIDPKSKERFNEFGVHIDDIYDLLFYVFVELDQIMVNSTVQDLYNKRVDVVHGILIEAYAKTIFHRFYRTNQKSTLKDLEVKFLLKMKPTIIDSAYSSRRKGAARNVSTAPQIFNDSWLESIGLYKIRHAGSAEQRFHPSMAVVESLVAFSGANIGVTGLINPFAQIGENGGIIRPDYADDIDELLQYLPST